ncbi:phage integrase central domain-containing protein [Agitococcus lubricus]
MSLLEKDIIPFIGKTPIDQLRSPDVLAVARRIDD